MPAVPNFTYTNQSFDPLWKMGMATSTNINLQASNVYTAGQVLGEVTGQSAVFSAALGGATGGTWTLSYQGQPVTVSGSTALAYNLSAANLQTALQALPAIGASNMTVSLAGTTYTITAAGTLANTPIELSAFVFGSSLLTGATSPALTITTAGQTATGCFGIYVHGGSGGLGTPKCINQQACVTDSSGYISYSTVSGGSGQWGQQYPSTGAWFFGFFSIAALIAANSNSLANLIGDSTGWSLEQGSISSGIGIIRAG